jgi:hypothetical protein
MLDLIKLLVGGYVEQISCPFLPQPSISEHGSKAMLSPAIQERKV